MPSQYKSTYRNDKVELLEEQSKNNCIENSNSFRMVLH